MTEDTILLFLSTIMRILSAFARPVPPGHSKSVKYLPSLWYSRNVLDGTLWDSSEQVAVSWSRALASRPETDQRAAVFDEVILLDPLAVAHDFHSQSGFDFGKHKLCNGLQSFSHIGISIDPYCNYGKKGTMWEQVAVDRLTHHDMYPEKIDNR